tara:strand:+ start:147 stop:596 length:450 start_codon:yes stop_codon:yes gene_type:complete
MAAGLFDHIKQITNVQDPKYFDKLDESDKRTWSNYMVLRFLSMNTDWIDLISEIQPYVQSLQPKTLYKLLIDILPKGRHYLKYVKGSKTDKYEGWLCEIVVKNYQCSSKEADEYLEILYATKFGRIEIKELCERYGIESKQITKLKLKV